MTPCPATLFGGPLRCTEDAATDHEHVYVSGAAMLDAEKPGDSDD